MKYYLNNWVWYGYDYGMDRDIAIVCIALVTLASVVSLFAVYTKRKHIGLLRNQAVSLLSLKVLLTTMTGIGILASVAMMLVPEASRSADLNGMKNAFGITALDSASEWGRLGSESDELPVHYEKDGHEHFGVLKISSDQHGRYVRFYPKIGNVI